MNERAVAIQKKRAPLGLILAVILGAGGLFGGDLYGHQVGYDEGYEKGYEVGHDSGYQEGHDKGEELGIKIGKKAVADSYYQSGFSAGYMKAKELDAQAEPKTPGTESDAVIVYVTASGAKYHRYGCGHLSRSCYKMTLADAKASGYTACSVCNPPA